MANEMNGVQLWENGPFWATCNLGAERPQDSGRYFWWGDKCGSVWKKGMLFGGDWIDGRGKKHIFDDQSTPSRDAEEVCPILGRHVNNVLQFLAFRHVWLEKFTLTKKNDAAARLLGGAWHMPTFQDLHDLMTKCDWLWDQLEGVVGYTVKGRDNFATARIFLPAAGYGSDNALMDYGKVGFYWSSSEYLTDMISPLQRSLGLGRGLAGLAFHLRFGKGNNYNVSEAGRCGGGTIRAIREA